MEAICLGMLAVIYWMTYAALNGADRLPDRIPTHFDISGQPNAWGPPGFLWFLPAVALTALGSIRFRRYNLPIAVTPGNLPFIQEQTAILLAWIKCEMLSLFAYLQWSIVQSAREGAFRLSPLLIPVFLVAVFSTVGWRLTIMIRGAKARADSTDPVNYTQGSR
jgi:hypothetical protein